MTDTSAIGSFTLTEQVVLLGITVLEEEDETPAQTHVLRRVCRTQLPSGETTVVGTITEADAMRSLYRLEAEGIVEEVQPDDPSPTGKGRPAYALDVDDETVYEGIDDELAADLERPET